MKRKISKIIISFLLTMVMVVGLMSGISLTAYAAPTEELLTTITSTGKEQASYSTANVATVSFSYTAGGSSAYVANWGWWGYGWTATVNAAEGYTITKCVFYDDQNRTATDSEAPFVVETTEEDKTPKVNGTPILANQSKGIKKIEVYGYATPAAALDPVSYMAWNGTTLVEKTGDDACTDYTVVTADTATFEDGKWYVVSNSVTVSSRITVTGTVNLILCDGATLTASKGITVNSGNTINIYAQIGGTGELNAGSDLNVASIGGGARYQSSGTVNIHGGKITATGGSNASGIGGALDGGNGEVNIYGGNVTARGKNYAAGIGGYSGKSGGTVNIYGGTVNASGSQSGTTGIGIGGTNPGNCVVHIYGGEVTATSEKVAAGIQGTVTIDGGTVTANGGVSEMIDGSSGETYSSTGINGTITVNGGTVTASGGNVTGGYAAIESYGGTIYACGGISGTVTISGGTVTATGGNVTGDINNYGGTIYACNGVNGTVTISGGTVTATGGSHTGNSSGTTVKEKGFGGSLTLGTGMYLYGGTSANPESNQSNYRAGAGDYTGDRYVYMTVNNVVPHTHSFNYTATGATITAACTAGCDITEGLALNISAPTKLTYDGSAKAATLSTGYNTTAFPGEYMIKYYKGANEVEAANVKAAGDYTAKVTVGEATASVDFTIAKATPSIETIPTASAVTYGQKLADSTLTGGTGSVAGGFAWKDSTVAPAVSDSQNTEYDVVFTPTDENYDAAECKVKLTVNKADSAVTTAPTAKTLTYNGSAQSLINAGTASGGTMKYAVTTANQEPAAEAYTFDNTSLPTATGAGTYYVWYKVKADENHNDTDANYVEVSIGKRSVTLTSATASKVYDGTALTNTDVTVGGDGFVTGEGATYNVTGTQTIPGNSKNTFDYTLKSGTTAGNYEITKTEGTLTVNDRTDEEGDDKKYEITVTANSNEFTYDGTEHSVSGFVQTAFTFNGVTYTVSGLTATAKGTDAGSYTAEVTGTAVVKDANDNDLTNQFIVRTSNGTLTINKRNVTLTSATASKTYDGNALADNTVTTSGDGFATGEGATYNVTGSQKVVGSSANAFAYTLNEGTKEANYNITKTEGTLTVTSRDAKYQISPQAKSDELKYDGQSHEVTGFETDTFTVEGNTYTVSGLTAAGSGTDAGSYTVSVSGTAVVKDSDGTDVSDQFSVTPQTGTLTINKRRVTMTSATDTKEYDGDALTNTEVTVTGDGFITGEGADYDVTGTRTVVGVSENTFTYTLKDNTKADNYDITTSYGTLTINNRNTKYEVTLTANSGTEKYDGKEKTVSGYTIDGNAGEGTGESAVTSFTASNGKIYTVTGMSAEVTGTNAGEYAVNVIGTPIVKDVDGNDVTTQFAVSSESGKLTIDKRSVTLTSATDTKVYDGKALSNDEITVSEDGFAEGEGATYDVTGSQTLAGESANAFTYALNEGTIADNYEITTVEGKLTVTKSDSSGEVTAVSGLVYDGKAKALVTAGKTEGGTLMYRLGTDGKWQQDIPEATDAGTYKIYYYIKGDDNHKDDGSEKEPKGSVETTIKKAAQDKPVETFAVAEASDDKTADGKISGLDKAKTYQYSADDGKTWTDVKAGSTEIVVKSGTYQIRYAEDKNHEAGKAASVTVTAKAAPSPEPAKTNATINLKSVTQKNNKVQVSWTKVNEADGYDVYIHYCGSKAKKAAKTIKGNSTTSASFKKIDGKKINQKKNFHVKVYAYKMVNGKKEIIAKTITAHLAGAKSVKYTNPKALKLTKSTYKIKVKKTAKIKAKVTLENSKKKLLPKSHGAKFRYKSSNTKIATVNKNGKITGKSKGTCYIYVYTINGLMKKVKVTVK